MVLCYRCVRSIRSRGEKIYVGELVCEEESEACLWCGNMDDELYYVHFKRSRYAGFDIDEYKNYDGEVKAKCRW
jgi:hypothetical protein